MSTLTALTELRTVSDVYQDALIEQHPECSRLRDEIIARTEELTDVVAAPRCSYRRRFLMSWASYNDGKEWLRQQLIGASQADWFPRPILTYDPRNVRVSFNGVEFDGMIDGTFVRVEPGLDDLGTRVFVENPRRWRRRLQGLT